MRDIILSLVVFGLLPKCFARPDIGLMVFCWLSYMNPHKLCWGFALAFPFAQVTALATLGGLLIWMEHGLENPAHDFSHHDDNDHEGAHQ
jgi:putative inorganic carbon (HCO3(-)) transporter